MSYIFDVDNKTFWSPCSSVGEAFMTELAALERIIGIDSGVVETMSALVDVDLAGLQEFIGRLTTSSSLDHPSLKSLFGGLCDHLIAILIAHSALPDSVVRVLEEEQLARSEKLAKKSMSLC